MKDWKAIAAASGLSIPAEDLERLLPPLDRLEANFRPLVKTIPHELEAALMFSPGGAR